MKTRISGVKAAALTLYCFLSGVHQVISAPFALSISQTDGFVVISWPTEYIGSQLQVTPDLASPWAYMINTIATNQVILPASSNGQFFRLHALSIPTLGLVAGYNFNGDANDFVGGRNGTNHGATPTSNRFTNGFSAYAFHGTNNYIQVLDDDIFSISTTGEFSISAWIRAGATNFLNSEGGLGQTDYAYWMGKGEEYGDDNGDQEWACRMYNYVNSENRPNWISFYVFNPPGGRGAGSRVEDPVTVQIWMHFVGTVSMANNGLIEWYKNGERIDFDPLFNDPDWHIVPQNKGAPVRFGTANFDSFFIGSIDNVYFYNRMLSSSEVIQLYNDQTR